MVPAPESPAACRAPATGGTGIGATSVVDGSRSIVKRPEPGIGLRRGDAMLRIARTRASSTIVDGVSPGVMAVQEGLRRHERNAEIERVRVELHDQPALLRD